MKQTKTVKEQRKENNLNIGCVIFMLILATGYCIITKDYIPAWAPPSIIAAFLGSIIFLIRNNVDFKKQESEQLVQQTA